MKTIFAIIGTFLIISACSAQDRTVGGPCEGCEALHEYGSRTLNALDTLPRFQKERDKLKISGTIYEKDGKTPAEGIILYVYQTDPKGIYPKKGDEEGWARRHGYIRGWIKTGKDGKYTFYTFRPASYPNTTVAQHIHATIKEPGLSAYYIDDFHFDDDPNFTSRDRGNLRNRGGSGVLKPAKSSELLIAKRDIILGKNIPGY